MFAVSGMVGLFIYVSLYGGRIHVHLPFFFFFLNFKAASTAHLPIQQ